MPHAKMPQYLCTKCGWSGRLAQRFGQLFPMCGNPDCHYMVQDVTGTEPSDEIKQLAAHIQHERSKMSTPKPIADFKIEVTLTTGEPSTIPGLCTYIGGAENEEVKVSMLMQTGTNATVVTVEPKDARLQNLLKEMGYHAGLDVFLQPSELATAVVTSVMQQLNKRLEEKKQAVTT